MSIEFGFDPVQYKRFRVLLDNIEGLPYRVMVNMTNTGETIMKQMLTGKILRVRTGRLRNSIGGVVFGKYGKAEDLRGVIGSGARSGSRVKYANIHVTGGTVSAKKGKYLAIPLPSALTRSGSQLKGGAMSARDFPNTFISRSKKGNLIIFQKRARSIVPLFVLKKSVRIPKRDYITATGDALIPRIPSLFKKSLAEVGYE